MKHKKGAKKIASLLKDESGIQSLANRGKGGIIRIRGRCSQKKLAINWVREKQKKLDFVF